MIKLDLACQVLTPLFMGGQNYKISELRTSSIKGVLRFWWRAINGHLSDAKLLPKFEAAIFGSAEQEIGRSRIMLELRNQDLQFEEIPMLPHRLQEGETENDQAVMRQAIMPNSTFTLRVKLLKDSIKVKGLNGEKIEILNTESLQSLVFLTFTLGGFGKRSRRGMGSIAITDFSLNGGEMQQFIMPQTTEDLLLHLNRAAIKEKERIKDYFKWDREIVAIKNCQQPADLLKIPCIEEVIKGAPTVKDLFPKHIGTVSHELKASNRRDYGPSLGDGGKNRLSSPVIVSAVPGENDEIIPIITKLRSLPPNGKANSHLQNTFIDHVLDSPIP